jgi:hypothetical protein
MNEGISGLFQLEICNRLRRGDAGAVRGCPALTVQRQLKMVVLLDANRR